MSESMTILKKYQLLNTKIGMMIFNSKEVPSDLILEHNKLLNDYNEQLKSESNGK